MPIYNYLCLKCGHQSEKIAKFDDPPPLCRRVVSANYFDPADIPESEPDGTFKAVRVLCGGETKKVLSRGSFQLKGGGWYKDGY